MRRLVCNPMIKYIIMNLPSKYEYSSLHSFTVVFDDKFHYSKYGKEENWTNQEKHKHQNANSHLSIQFIIINLHTKYDNSSLHSFTEIFDDKFHYFKYELKEN